MHIKPYKKNGKECYHFCVITEHCLCDQSRCSYSHCCVSRFHCLKLFVATTLLMCTKLVERSQLLHKWIVVASHLKGIMGNLFSFAAVVDGLLLEQVCETMELLF